MTAPGYERDPDGRVSCMRLATNGRRLGWCGIAHRYEDRARTHVRVLNRESRTDNPEAWIVVPLTVAKGTR